MRKQYKVIFLDWDDTIGNWSRAEYSALCDVYRLYHLDAVYASADDFIATYQPYNQNLWKQYGCGGISKEELQLKRFLHVLPDNTQEALAREIGDAYLQLTNRYFSLLPHAEKVVRYLASKYPLTIISNGFKEVQHYKFAHSGLADCFAYILISEEVGVNKPQPGIFEKALELNGVRADEAIMIGDSLTSDIAGAKNAGIDTIWVHPEGDVADIREIMNIL
ncbi:MAG: YjjG family noncanonical pyrimidine nucleotidase [Paludibacteraceae bacterium]|nr:YjjG family noncanonical pyrimidine nucleotidase [Paludibacteraceae bacterium]